MVLGGSGVGIWKMVLRKMGSVFDEGRDAWNWRFEVVFNAFGEIVSRAIATRDDRATWNVGFV